MLTGDKAFTRHLYRWLVRPYSIGESDCATFVIEWLESKGVDCSNHFAKDYSTKYEGLRRYARGGIREAFEVGLPEVGLVESVDLTDGDPVLTLDSVGLYCRAGALPSTVWEYTPKGLLVRPVELLERGFTWPR